MKHNEFKRLLIDMAARLILLEEFDKRGESAERDYLRGTMTDLMQKIINEHKRLYGHFVETEKALDQFSTKEGVRAWLNESEIEVNPNDPSDAASNIASDLHEYVSMVAVADMVLDGYVPDDENAVDKLLYQVKCRFLDHKAEEALALIDHTHVIEEVES